MQSHPDHRSGSIVAPSGARRGVLTIAYYFNPGTSVGALRVWRFHRYLAELGYDSRVMAALKNPDDNSPQLIHIPDVVGAFWDTRIAKIAAGEKPTEPLTLAAHIERAVRKFLFPGHYGVTWSYDVAEAGRKLIQQNPSIQTVLSSYPALGTHLAALQLARRTRVRWIADFRDPFGFAPGQETVLARWSFRRLERLVFRYADAVIANTEAVAVQWRRQYPWAKDKIHVIWNGFDPDAEDELPLPIPVRQGKVWVHTGSLYAGRNANAILRSLARLRERSVAPALEIRISLVGWAELGSGLDSGLYERAIEEGWLEMTRRPVPRAKAMELTRQADGLVLLQPQSALQVPAKLFEYLRIGRPILALAPPNSSIEWILSKAGVPYVCLHDADSPAVADQKLLRFLALSNTPTSANAWFQNNFDARKQAQQLAGLIESLHPSRPLARSMEQELVS